MKTKSEMSMKVIKIETEDQFAKIKFLPFNRAYSRRSDLEESMNKFGFVGTVLLIETDLIIGKKELYIAEGQNRLKTAQDLGIPVYGFIVGYNFKDKSELVDFVAKQNITQKKWTPADYVNTYCNLGYSDYLILNRIKDTNGYSLPTIATILQGINRSSSTSAIQNGTFKCNFKKETLNTLRIAKKVMKYSKMSNRMLIALHHVSLTSNFNEEEFVTRYRFEHKKMRGMKLDSYTDLFASWFK